MLGDGRLAVSHGTGETRLGVLDPDSGRLTDLDLPYQVYASGLSAADRTIATIAGGPAGSAGGWAARYLDGLVGPLPECDAVYAERAPVGHVNDATCPVLLLQGLDDPVVPPAQAESIAADLAAHSIPYAYITFEGESHGFRRAESIVASLEAELSFYGQIMGFTPPGVLPVPLASG